MKTNSVATTKEVPALGGEATQRKRYPDYVAQKPRVVVGKHPERDLAVIWLSRLPGLASDQVLVAIEQPCQVGDAEDLVRFAGPSFTATKSIDLTRDGGKAMRVHVMLHGLPSPVLFFLEGPAKDGLEFLAFEPSIYLNEGKGTREDGAAKKAVLGFSNWPGAKAFDQPRAFEVEALPAERLVVPQPRRFQDGFGNQSTITAVTRVVAGEVCVEVEHVFGLTPTLFRPFQAPSEEPSAEDDGGGAGEAEQVPELGGEGAVEADAEVADDGKPKRGKRPSRTTARRAKEPAEVAPIEA